MTFISHKVYKDGIENRFLPKAGNYPKLFIVLLGTTADNNYKPIAISSLKWKETSDSQEKDSFIGNPEGAGITFINKVLKLPSVMFNATKSLLSTEATDNATHFAIVEASEEASSFTSTGIDDEQGAFVDNITNSSQLINNPDETKTLENNEVLMIGELSNNPQVDSKTNFYFSGAEITFTEVNA